MPAGDRYVQVHAADMFAFLEGKGFRRRDERTDRFSVSEVVYERLHVVDARYRVLIYTSIGKHAGEARGCGGDAIRVVAVYEDGTRSFGVAKLPRVFRTGSVEKVLERTIERAREAYSICNQRIRQRRS